MINFRPEAAGINEGRRTKDEGRSATYNLAGQRVGDDYKGIIIKNGKKIVK